MTEIYEQTSKKIQNIISVGGKAILITGPAVRRYVKAFFAPVLPELEVLSISELLPNIVINTIGSVGLESYD